MAHTVQRGAAPAGFVRAAPAPGVAMLVTRGLDAAALAAQVLAPPPDAPVRHLGRAGLHAFPLDEGGCALVRACRHGGLLRGFTRGWFVSRPPRPFVELAVTVAARERGVATPDILAAVVAWGCGPWYRGWLVTRELAGARNLWDALREPRSAEEKRRLLRRTGRALRTMHAGGVDHADLNLRNILARDGVAGPEICIIDFDKARLSQGPLPSARARANLSRLLRSVNKLDRAREYIGTPDWRCLLTGYGTHR